MWFVLLLSLATATHAQGLGGSLGVATDDVFRGLSQNDGRRDQLFDPGHNDEAGLSRQPTLFIPDEAI